MAKNSSLFSRMAAESAAALRVPAVDLRDRVGDFLAPVLEARFGILGSVFDGLSYRFHANNFGDAFLEKALDPLVERDLCARATVTRAHEP